MQPFGIGIDVVETARFRQAVERQGEPFLQRLFLETELAYCASQKDPIPCQAARFALKEAVSKAMGTGIGEHLGWHDIEINRKDSGEPYVILRGVGAETAARLGVQNILVSITHTEHYAAANAIAFRGGQAA